MERSFKKVPQNIFCYKNNFLFFELFKYDDLLTSKKIFQLNWQLKCI